MNHYSEPTLKIIPSVSTAVLTGGVSDLMIGEIRRNGCNRVVVKDGDFSDASLLLELSNSIETLIIGSENFDWSILPKLLKLAKLDIGGWFKCDIDFQSMKSLEYLWTYWNEGYDERIFRIKGLKALRIHGFKSADFQGLSNLQELVYLGIYYSRKLEKVSGIEKLRNLKRLDLANCPALLNVTDIGGNSSLESLRIEFCKRLHTLQGIDKCKNLIELNLFKCAKLKSLAPLQNMEELRWLIFDCQTEDGNLEFLYQMKKLDRCEFKDKKNYNVSDQKFRLHLRNENKFKLGRFSDWYAFGLGQAFPSVR